MRVKQSSQSELTGARHGALVVNDFETLSAQLALITQIENGLHATQNALLSRNVEDLERATQELRRLQGQLKQLVDGGCERGSSSILEGGVFPLSPTTDIRQLAREVRIAQARALHLGRVQIALLERAKRSLTVISYLIAGRAASYGPAGLNRTLMPVATDSFGDCECRA
jgi:hypothetical protein